MSWSDPRTWSVGGTVTASQLNVDIRDNMNYLLSQVGWGFGLAVTADPRSDVSTSASFGGSATLYSRTIGSGQVSTIRFRVTVSSGSVSCAVYDNSGTGLTAAASTRQATSGAVACPSVGVANVSLGSTVSVHRGDWLAISANNSSAAMSCGTAETTMLDGFAGRQAVHPAPSSASMSVATQSIPVMIGY